MTTNLVSMAKTGGATLFSALTDTPTGAQLLAAPKQMFYIAADGTIAIAPGMYWDEANDQFEIRGGVNDKRQLSLSGASSVLWFTPNSNNYEIDSYSLNKGLTFGVSGFANAMTIRYGGNVGINQTIPLAKLHVKGSADDEVLILQAHSTQTSNILEVQKSSGTNLIFIKGSGEFVTTGTMDIQGNASVNVRYGKIVGYNTDTGARATMRINEIAFHNADNVVEIGKATHDNSSGLLAQMAIIPTYNQTGTADSTDLLINRVETALGSGNHYLADFQVGGVSKLSVDNSGTLQAAGYKSSDGSVGLTTTFLNGSGATVTVKNGLITSIA